MSSVASSATRQSTDVRMEKATPMLNEDDLDTASGVLVTAQEVTLMKDTQKNQRNEDKIIMEDTNQGENHGQNLLQDGTLLKPVVFDFILDSI